MNARIARAAGLVLALGLIVMPGCSKKSNPVQPQPVNPGDVNAVVEQAGKLAPLGPDKDQITGSDTTETQNFRYVTETHDAAKNIQEITYLGLNDDIVWAGSLIKGAQAHQFVYEPVVGVVRNPITLSINLESSGSGSTISQTVADPKLSTVRQGISDLLTRALGSGTQWAAKAQFEKTQVYSESQLDLSIGAMVRYGAGDLRSKFNWSSTTLKNKIIAKYQQLYYTIDMDTPKTPADVFASSNTLDAIKAAIPPGSCPMYVAGVTYGMMALTFIETDYNQTDMEAALAAAYSATPNLDIEVRSGLTARTVLANSSIKTVVYGGASAGLDQIQDGYEGFIRVVHASIQLGTASPGVPLIYKFRHLRDNTLAQVTLTSQYALTKAIRLQQLMQLTIDKIVCEWANDDCGDDQVEMNVFKVWVNAAQQKQGGPVVPTFASDTLVYNYDVSGYGHQMNDGDVHDINRPVMIWFDTEQYDFNLATIKLKAQCHDNDATIFCVDSWPEASTTIPSSAFGTNPQKLMLYAPDYRMRLEATLTPANRPARAFALQRR